MKVSLMCVGLQFSVNCKSRSNKPSIYFDYFQSMHNEKIITVLLTQRKPND